MGDMTASSSTPRPAVEEERAAPPRGGPRCHRAPPQSAESDLIEDHDQDHHDDERIEAPVLGQVVHRASLLLVAA